MNENINLCEILKDCPEGTKFCSYVHGEVKFIRVEADSRYPIRVMAVSKGENCIYALFTKEGYVDGSFNNAKCILVPSFEQPEWGKWKCPKPKFDPKTLQPFDKVLARETQDDRWYADFVCMPPNEGDNVPFTMSDEGCNIVIPYNEETKHLVGTTDEAPEYYRYWED